MSSKLTMPIRRLSGPTTGKRRTPSARMRASASSIGVFSVTVLGCGVITSRTSVRTGSLPCPTTRVARSRSVRMPIGSCLALTTISVPTLRVPIG
jgi:hypothetical protein